MTIDKLFHRWPLLGNLSDRVGNNPERPFELYKCSLKFLRFSLFRLWRNVRADFFGSAAGGGAALTLRAAKRRANNLT